MTSTLVPEYFVGDPLLDLLVMVELAQLLVSGIVLVLLGSGQDIDVVLGALVDLFVVKRVLEHVQVAGQGDGVADETASTDLMIRGPVVSSISLNLNFFVLETMSLVLPLAESKFFFSLIRPALCKSRSLWLRWRHCWPGRWSRL